MQAVAHMLKGALFAVVLAALPVMAQEKPSAEVAPDVLVKQVTTEVLDLIRADADIRSGDTRKVNQLIEEKVLPNFNFTRMTSLAVGRDWRRASPEQKKRLTDEFRTLLVRTYSNALTAYRDQTIRYKPVRMSASDTDVVVKTEVRQPGAASIPLDYALEKENGQWKVYDVIVSGVSLVTNYRDSFGHEVRSAGIDGLIGSLASKNKEYRGNNGGSK